MAAVTPSRPVRWRLVIPALEGDLRTARSAPDGRVVALTTAGLFLVDVTGAIRARADAEPAGIGTGGATIGFPTTPGRTLAILSPGAPAAPFLGGFLPLRASSKAGSASPAATDASRAR